MSLRLMDSKPPAMPTPMTPDCTADATLMKACRPDEHCLASTTDHDARRTAGHKLKAQPAEGEPICRAAYLAVESAERHTVRYAGVELSHPAWSERDNAR